MAHEQRFFLAVVGYYRLSTVIVRICIKRGTNQSINAHEGFISHVGGRPNTAGVSRK